MSKRKSAKYSSTAHGRKRLRTPQEPSTAANRTPSHGQRRQGKVSDFGLSDARQAEAQGLYGDVTEKQFKQTFQQASG